MTTPTTVQVRLQIRADTASNWAAVNPVLLANELGLETDTKKFKVGNGSSAWNSLAYFPSIVSGGTVLGNLEIGSTGTLTFEGSTADGFETTLGVVDPTADRTILLPNQSGTVVVGGNASITDADIAANAEIAVSKLANGTANQVLVTDGTDVSWSDNLTLAGDLTVNGTTTTINTETLTVKDKNIELAVVDTPTDVTADGGGITLKGTTDKTINWVDATDAWTSSERFSVPLGSAAVPSLTFTGDPNTGIYSPGADQLALSTNGTGRLFVDSSGRVGVGRSPVAYGSFNVLDLAGSAGAIQKWVHTGSTVELQAYASATLTAIGSATNHPLIFTTNDTERMRLTATGLGIGTASPSSLIHAVGTAANLILDRTSDSPAVVFKSNGANIAGISTSSSNIRFEIGSGLTEAARIDSSGRLLVGTSSASYSTTVKLQGNSGSSTGESRIRLCRGTASPANGDTLAILGFSDNTETPSAEIAAQRDGGTWSASSVPGRLVFSTTADGASSPTERMRITSAGALKVSTSGSYNSNTDAVHELYSNTSSYRMLRVDNGSNVSGSGNIQVLLGSNCNDTSSYYFIGNTGGLDRINIFGNGNVQNTNNSYGSLSDIKLKENIVNANSQWSDIKALQVRNYNFKEGQTHTQIGLIAQEVELVSPGLVTESPDRDAEGNDLGTTTKSVNYSVLYMKAVKALQEAMERIELLEARLDAANL